LTLICYPKVGNARVDVNIGVNIGPPPPPIVIAAPPPVVVIPGTYVYFPPDVRVDIFFYQGYWYRPHHGHWYRSAVYNGKWVYVQPARVPHALVRVPPDFRRVPPGHQRIKYVEVKKNWRTWEKQKHWDKHEVRHADNHDVRKEHGDREDRHRK
jgi:hypothetical protein